ERLVVEAGTFPDRDDRLQRLDVVIEPIGLLGKYRMRHQGAHAGALQQRDKLVACEPRGHGHTHEPGGPAAVIGLQVFAAVRQRDAIALGEAEPVHRIAEPVEALVEPPERPAPRLVNDRAAIAISERELCKLGADMLVTTLMHVTSLGARRGRRPRAAPSWRG